MPLIRPSGVTVSIPANSLVGTFSGDMSALNVQPGMELFVGSRAGRMGDGRVLTSFVLTGATGATGATFEIADPLSASAITALPFVIDNFAAPTSIAAQNNLALTNLTNALRKATGLSTALDQPSKTWQLDRGAGAGTFSEWLFSIVGRRWFAAEQRTIAGVERLFTRSYPDGTSPVDSIDIDGATGGVKLLSAEGTIASAATCDIASVRADRVVVTGTTAIASFGTAKLQKIWVRFAGSLLLTHNATSLVLPGGKSLNTAAGDNALFASDPAGNWRCLAYQRVDGGASASGAGSDPRSFTSVEPTLDLDFREGFTHPNFTRASSALRWRPTGILETVGVNVARIEFNPATGVRRGLLIEGQKTNRAPNSNIASFSADKATVVADAGRAPDGSSTAVLLRENSENGPHRFGYIASVNAGRFTHSLFVKAAGRTVFHFFDSEVSQGVVADLLAGTIIASQGNAPPAYGMIPCGDGWWRIWVSVDYTSTTSFIVFGLSNAAASDPASYLGDGSSGMLFWDWQTEAGSLSSLIRTAGAAVTRAAESLPIPTAGWLSEREGTFFVEGMTPLAAGAANECTVFHVDDGSFLNRLNVYLGYGRVLFSVGVAGSYRNIAFNGISPGAPFRLAVSYRAGRIALFFNGALVDQDNAFPAPPSGLTTLRVGALAPLFTDAEMKSTIARLLCFPRALPDDVGQRMTAQ